MGAFLDGGQRGDVAAEESEFHTGVGGLDGGGKRFSILGVATAEDDVCGIVLCEGADRAGSETCGTLWTVSVGPYQVLCDFPALTSSDEDDLPSKAGDVGIWVEAGRRHCFSWCDGEVEEWK